MPRAEGVSVRRDAVSIRARPGGRAMRHRYDVSHVYHQFQSAPGREAGRCLVVAVEPDGRQGVSIRARPGGRAMHRRRPRQHRPAKSFNPRPAGRPGDAAAHEAVGDGLMVSIRARPGGRAMRRSARRVMRFLVFQSAPGREAGRCPARRGRARRAAGFNPRPAGRPGDAGRHPRRADRAGRFNPRPAGRPGDAY